MAKFLDNNGLNYFWQKVKAAISANTQVLALTLPASWVLSGETYKQTISGTVLSVPITAGQTKIDCLADATVKQTLEAANVEELWFQNENGAAVAYIRGRKPTNALTIQVRITN